MAHYSSQLLY